jgi:WD40 repeat protein
MCIHRSIPVITLAALALACTPAPALRAETRTWTDNTGKYKIEADFEKIEDGQVHLQRTDGKKLSLPLAKLSKDDQSYLKDLMKRRRAGQSEPANPFGDEPQGAGAPPKEARAAIASARRMAAGANDEPKYNVGDQVEIKDGFQWQKGEVVGFDKNGWTAYVKLEGGKMSDVHIAPFNIRPFDPTLGALAGVEKDDLARVDLTRIRRIVPLGGETAAFKPDPAAAPAPSFDPRPIGLNPKTNFFERVVGVSFAKGGGVAVLGRSDVRGESLSQVEICDLKSGDIKGMLRGPRGLKMLAVAPSGQQLISISEPETFVSGPLQLWSIDSNELKHVKSWQVSSGERGQQLEWIGWIDDQRVMTVDRNSATVWSIDGPKGLYQVAGEGMKSPAFSPGGKQFAIGANDGISVHDVASGTLLAKIPLEHSFGRYVAFSPSGKFLAATGSQTVDVFDLATGKKTTVAYAASAGSDKGLCWLDEEHVLVGGSDLIHLPSQMTIWTYQHNAESIAQIAGRVWYAFASGPANQTMALLPFKLPHGAVKPVSEKDLVLRPGDEIAVEAEQTFDLTRPQQDGRPAESTKDQLTKALTDAGFKVVENSNKKLIGRKGAGENKEINYRRFGAPFGQTEKTSYSQRLYELELTVDGQTVWRRQRVMDAPFHLQLKEGESVDQALERVLTADTGFFRSTIPSRVLPTELEKARTSKLSLNGIE